MAARTIVIFYTATLILSAFLLFSVEPMFAKMILPLLGGSPSVWNTAMVFFQAMLLAGYTYAHFMRQLLAPRLQGIVHLGLMLLCAIFLPIALPRGLHPSGDPALWQIGIMLACVGGPFFVLSALAPLLQSWFAATRHKNAGNPYFLYAASNIGSMVALLCYPLLIEPEWTITQQSHLWAGLYAVLTGLVGLSLLFVWQAKNPPAAAQTPLTMRLKLYWVGLAFLPSSLLIGVTTYITADLASLPLLWVVPLALYLLTFILVFARHSFVSLKASALAFMLCMFGIFVLMALYVMGKGLPLMGLHLLAFFFAALLCHKKLSDLRPAAANLTGFYFYMSLGGVLGGLFSALLAPLLFVVPVEYLLGLCVVVLLAVYDLLNAKTRPLAPALAIIFSVMFLLYSPLMGVRDTSTWLTQRNFFGIMRVMQADDQTLFMHGTTLHGAQPLDAKYRLMPMTYYNPLGPVGDLFKILDQQGGPQKIAALGLGTGTMACYFLPGRHFDFFEINPDVVKIAENKKFFTYLSDCGSPYSVTLGDGRLSLSAVPDASYDVLILDAFSSDNIPTHLLTLDAFRVYMRKVRANGIILVNISNRYLTLEPQIAALSAATGVPALLRHSIGHSLAPKSSLYYADSVWAVFTPDPKTLLALVKNDWHAAKPARDYRIWTDDYANIIASLNIVQAKNK